MREKLEPYLVKEGERAGKLEKYAWPGGYPLFYLTKRNSVLCPDCASAALEDEDDPPIYGGANWEDPALYCEDCSKRIESAYAEDDVDGCKHEPRYEACQIKTCSHGSVTVVSTCRKCGFPLEAKLTDELFREP